MKGTEKQIMWAEDIKSTVISTIDTMLEMAKKDPNCNTESVKSGMAKFLKARDAMVNCENAHDIIEVYKTVSQRNSDAANMKEIARIIRNRFGLQYETTTQQALIGE